MSGLPRGDEGCSVNGHLPTKLFRMYGEGREDGQRWATYWCGQCGCHWFGPVVFAAGEPAPHAVQAGEQIEVLL